MEDPVVDGGNSHDPQEKGPAQLTPLEVTAKATGIGVNQLRTDFGTQLHLFHPLKIHYREYPELVFQDPDNLFEIAKGITASDRRITLRGFSTEYQRASETLPGMFWMSNVCMIQEDYDDRPAFVSIAHGQEGGDIEEMTLRKDSFNFSVDTPGMKRMFFASFDRSTTSGNFELRSLRAQIKENELLGSEIEYSLERDENGALVPKLKFQRGNRTNWRSEFEESPSNFELIEEPEKPRTLVRKEGEKVVDVWEVPDFPADLLDTLLPLDVLVDDPENTSMDKEKIWKNFRARKLGLTWEQVDNDAFNTMPQDRRGRMGHWRHRW